MLLRVKLWLGAAVAVLLGLLGAWVAGKREARSEARSEALRGDAKRHKDMNDADIGVGATDEQHVKWLRDFAERNQR